MSEMRVEYVPLDGVTGAERNPKLHDYETLAASIRRFGFAAPIAMDERTGRLVAGHGRLETLRRMHQAGEPLPSRIKEHNGAWLVPVIRGVEFADDREAEAFLIADNRISALGGWDAEGLKEIMLEQVDLDGIGFQMDDIDSIMADALASTSALLSDPEDLTEPEIPEPPKDPITQQGDVWILGDHAILCGDCRNPVHMDMLMGSAHINVAFTSPPYASQRKYDESSGFKPIAPDDYVEWFEKVQAGIKQRLASDGSWFVNIKEHCEDKQRHLYVKDLTIAHVREWGWKFIDELVWKHHGFPGIIHSRFRNAWEPILHFAGDEVKIRPDAVAYASEAVIQFEPGKSVSMSHSPQYGASADNERSAGMAYPRNVIEMSNGASTSIAGHGATFPLGLPEFFIKAYSDKGDVIMDPFMGSGTTMIAAEKLERCSFGTEISPAYCDVIVERWEQVTGGKAVRR